LGSSTSVAAVYYPPNNQLEVFFVDTQGALSLVWKAQNGPWNRPFRLTVAGFATPGAPVAAVFYPLNNQLEVFVVDAHGTLTLFWKAQNGAWNSPFQLSSQGFAPAGTPVAAVYYPPNNQLEVFLIDRDGAFNVVWKAQNGRWNAPFALTPKTFAAALTPLSAVYYPPNNQLEVFHIDRHGALIVMWKAQNGSWNAPVALTDSTFAPPGAPLSAAYYPVNNQLEVFAINPHGALALKWKAQNENWRPAITLTQDGYATPGLPPVAVYYALNQQLEVLFADSHRCMNVVWKANNGAWAGPVPITLTDCLGSAVTWAAVHYPLQNQLEAFTTNTAQVLFVEWKVNNGPWSPCPVPLTDSPPAPPPAATVLETVRIAQLTGPRDPQGLPILNNTTAWRVPGVDLGASTDHNGNLFFFFGDVPRADRNQGPPQDADLVAFSSDTQVGPHGITLHPVMQGPWFHPFTIEPPFGVPATNRTPTGAFSFGGRAYVFAVVNNPQDPTGLPVSILTSSAHPEQAGQYRVEFQFDHFRFWQVAPVVVNNAWVDGLPLPSGPGLILYGHGDPGAIHLAWMPLPVPTRGRAAPDGIRYYTGNGRNPWSPQAADAKVLISHPPYTSVSACFFPDAKLWILVYSNAGPPKEVPFAITGPIVARFGPTPWNLSGEVQLFNPCRERAYGSYMHWPGLDTIVPDIPPLGEEQGWAYGAFLTNRYCHWDNASRTLTLYYLLSLNRPYQVQLMRTRLRIS